MLLLTLQVLSSPLQDPSLSPTFFSCVDFALKAFPLQMAKALCGNGFQAGHFQFVIHLLRHDLVEIRLEAVKELLANGGMANKDIDMEVLYVLLTETLADRDAEVRLMLDQ